MLDLPCTSAHAGFYLRFPREMYRTGGSSLTGLPDQDVYTFIPQCTWHDRRTLEQWFERVNSANGNPAYMLDETQNAGAGSAKDYFRLRRVIGLRYDGSVNTRWARGELSRKEVFGSDDQNPD
jgi:hypothetical protein